MNPAKNKALVEKFDGIARKFLIRDNGFTEIEANNEIHNMRLWLGHEALFAGFGDLKFVNLPYVKMRRVGRLKKLDRRARIAVALSFENALNHATYMEEAA